MPAITTTTCPISWCEYQKHESYTLTPKEGTHWKNALFFCFFDVVLFGFNPPTPTDKQPEWPPSFSSHLAYLLSMDGWDLAECGWDLALEWMRSSRVWMRSSRVWMRSSRAWMRSNRVWMRSSREWMRSSRVWMRSITEWLERLTANAVVLSWVQPQHTSTQWNLRGGRWSSVEYRT